MTGIFTGVTNLSFPPVSMRPAGGQTKSPSSAEDGLERIEINFTVLVACYIYARPSPLRRHCRDPNSAERAESQCKAAQYAEQRKLTRKPDPTQHSRRECRRCYQSGLWRWILEAREWRRKRRPESLCPRPAPRRPRHWPP